MADVVVMPKLGLTMETGTVNAWLVGEGEQVSVGMVIAEITTEKITYDLESEAEGVLLKIIVPEDGEVPVRTPIALIGQPGEDLSLYEASGAGEGARVDRAPPGAAAPPPVAARPDTRIIASPAAKKLAYELGIDLALVGGTGPGGRITLDDVTTAASIPAAAGAQATIAAAELRGGVRGEVAYSGMRRAIGEHMAASQAASPTVTEHTRADVQELKELLASVNATRADDDKVTVTAAIVRAVALALERMPGVNATIEGDVVKVWGNINIGVAVALSEGLIVPVIKEANRKPLGEIAREIKDLAGRARENKLLPDETAGGTFTVSALGPYRSVDWFTPILNQPEAAILGTGRMIDEVVAIDGVPVVRAMIGLSLTFDHRIVYGADGAEFLGILLEYLGDPSRLAAAPQCDT